MQLITQAADIPQSCFIQQPPYYEERKYAEEYQPGFSIQSELYGFSVESIVIPNGPSYLLKRNVFPHFSFTKLQEWAFFYEGFEGVVEYGRGKTKNDAKSCWKWNLHSEIEYLTSLRPFQMTQEEKKKWYGLLDIVDINKHVRSKPYKTREHVVIGRRVGAKVTIKHPGRNEETVDMEKVAGADRLAGLRDGKRVYIDMDRSRSDNSIIEIHGADYFAFAFDDSTDLEVKTLDDHPEAEL